MEANLISLEELKQSWRMLSLEIHKNNHLKTELQHKFITPVFGGDHD